MNLPKKIFFDNCTFYVSKNVYEPAEDTFLLAENLKVNKHDIVLDMGTGCGILAVLAAKKAKKVVAVDINPYAVRCAKRNAGLNKVKEKVEVRQGNLFESIRETEKFTLIIFNAPYLPSTQHEQRSWLNKAWAGGPRGRQVIDNFITQASKHLAKNGRALLLQSTLSNVKETLRKFKENRMHASVVAERKLDFETIVVIEAKVYKQKEK